MIGKIIGVIIILFIIFGLFVPINSIGQSDNSTSVAITYGETTYNNPEYKSTVDSYFEDNSDVDMDDVGETVITADDVNKISQDISQKTYNSDQVLSCAMVDMDDTDEDLTVDVDESKITTVTEDMYKSALNSSGITKGHVVVTSPTTATGESALAGVMNSYESVTGIPISDSVKDAANKEIYTQSQVVEDSNATPEEVADLVDLAKEEAADEKTSDNQTIVKIINNIASSNNISISQDDANILADSIADTQSVQDEASDYESQMSDYIDSEQPRTLFGELWDWISSLINEITGASVDVDNATGSTSSSDDSNSSSDSSSNNTTTSSSDSSSSDNATTTNDNSSSDNNTNDSDNESSDSDNSSSMTA